MRSLEESSQFQVVRFVDGAQNKTQGNDFATDVASANFVKRQLVKSILEGNLETVDLSDEDLATATMIADEDGELAAIIPHKWEDPSSPRPTPAGELTSTAAVSTPTASDDFTRLREVKVTKTLMGLETAAVTWKA
jgi:hypothetical protein